MWYWGYEAYTRLSIWTLNDLDKYLNDKKSW